MKRVGLLERPSPQEKRRERKQPRSEQTSLSPSAQIVPSCTLCRHRRMRASTDPAMLVGQTGNNATTHVYTLSNTHTRRRTRTPLRPAQMAMAEKRKEGIQQKHHAPGTERQSTERTGAQPHTRTHTHAHTREGRQTGQPPPQHHTHTNENTEKKAEARRSPIDDTDKGRAASRKSTAEQISNLDRLMGGSAMLAHHFPRCLPSHDALHTTPPTHPHRCHHGHQRHRKGVRPRSLYGRWLIRCRVIIC